MSGLWASLCSLKFLYSAAWWLVSGYVLYLILLVADGALPCSLLVLWAKSLGLLLQWHCFVGLNWICIRVRPLDWYNWMGACYRYLQECPVGRVVGFDVCRHSYLSIWGTGALLLTGRDGVLCSWEWEQTRVDLLKSRLRNVDWVGSEVFQVCFNVTSVFRGQSLCSIFLRDCFQGCLLNTSFPFILWHFG